MTARRLKPAVRKRDTAHAAAHRRLVWIHRGIVAGLCLIHFVLAVTSVRHKSNTYDEIAHLTRGYSYFIADDFRLGPPHPPLAHYWAALPGLRMPVKFPPLLIAEDKRQAWHESDMWEVGRQFFYYRNLGNAAIIDSLLLRGRAMIALWSVALGLLTYGWARRLFGPLAGLLALGLYAFSPTMLAHAPLVTTDMAAALFFMASLTTIWWLLHHVRPLSVLASAAALAGLFLAKLSAVLIIPVGAVLLILRLIRGGPLPVSWGRRQRAVRARPAQLGYFLGVLVFWIAAVYTSIWAAYGFRYAAMVDADPQRDHFYTNSPIPPDRTIWQHVLRGKVPAAGEPLERGEISRPFRDAIDWLRDHRVFPEAYIYSAAYARQTARGRNSFLDGELALKGFALFFPKAFLYKTPLPLLGMIVAGAAALGLRRKLLGGPPPEAPTQRADPLWSWHPADEAAWSFRTALYWSAPLWVFFVLYWYSSVRATLNIGHRHILPTYPVLFIVCGAAALLWQTRRTALRAVPATLLGLFVAASLATYPHYLTYFNRIAGGPNQGYRHLVDSSLDWGQDLPGLSDYLKTRRAAGDTTTVFLSYFGSAGSPGMHHYGIEATTVPPFWPRDAVGDLRDRPGLYAISVTNLQQVYPGITKAGERLVLNPWTQTLEDIYRRLLPQFEECMAAPNAPAGRAAWATGNARREMQDFLTLRFARLCAYLRSREPDHVVNHTIMIYALDQAELDAAYSGPIDVVR